MVPYTELQTVVAKMTDLLDRRGIARFDAIDCDHARREVFFLWSEPKRAVAVELDRDGTHADAAATAAWAAGQPIDASSLAEAAAWAEAQPSYH
jgi:hypothetical protein